MYFNLEHKQMVENRGYIYIYSYDRKEVTLDSKNKNKNKIHIRVKCPYCKKKYDIDIYTFRNGSHCKYCCHEYKKSFAYYIEEELGLDLNDVWDWEENSRRGINPWDILIKSDKIIYIWCQDKWYHGSYKTAPSLFYKGRRCPYCNPFASHRVHKLDSFGYLYPEKAKYWDYEKNKNKKHKTPFDVAPHSTIEKYWFKCEKCNTPFERSLNSMNREDTGVVCEQCNGSQLEQKVKKVLDKYNQFYYREKEFNNLIGHGKRNLRFDFYLPNHNLLIECNGKQHEEFTSFFCKNKADFEIQLEHDRRKKQYAIDHNINFLEIWYYDVDNIEQILTKQLNL